MLLHIFYLNQMSDNLLNACKNIYVAKEKFRIAC